MAFDDRASEAMQNVLISGSEGHGFVMQEARLAHLQGKVGYREGQTIRTITESGAGQSRSQQPAGAGGVPT